MALFQTKSARRPIHISPIGAVFMIGIAALTAFCAYKIEVHAISILLQRLGAAPLVPGLFVTVAAGLAATLALSKLALSGVVAARRVVGRGAVMPQLMRALCFALSLGFCLVALGSETIAPNAGAVYNNRLKEVSNREAIAVDNLEADLQRRADAVTNAANNSRASETARIQARLADLNAQLDVERGIGGQKFEGAKFKKIEAQVSTAQQLLAARIDVITSDERSTLAEIAAEGQKTRDALAVQAKNDRAAIDLNQIANAPEAQHPSITVVAKIVATVMGQDRVNPILITVGLTLLLTIVVECIPMLLVTHVLTALGGIREAALAKVTQRNLAADPSVQRSIPKVTQDVAMTGQVELITTGVRAA